MRIACTLKYWLSARCTRHKLYTYTCAMVVTGFAFRRAGYRKVAVSALSMRLVVTYDAGEYELGYV